MLRSLSGFPLRSIANVFCKPKSLGHGQRNAIEKLELSRTLTTINDAGHEFFAYREKSSTKSLQVQIVDALSNGERSRASNMLLNLGSGGYPLTAYDFVYILKYCAKSPDPLFVLETWRFMEEKEIDMNYICYLHVIQALCKGGYLDEAWNLIKFLGESRGIYPNLTVYNCFLEACIKTQSMVHVNQCLGLMEHRKVGKNEKTYSELLELAVWQKNPSVVHEIWRLYVKQYSLTVISLRKFIWSFTRLKDLKSAYQTLQHMVAVAIRGRFFINKNAERRLYSSRLDIPVPTKGELESQKETLEEDEYSTALKLDTDACNMEQCTGSRIGNEESLNSSIGMLYAYKSMPATKVLTWSFTNVIQTCVQAQNFELAEQLMLQMQSLGLQPSERTYDVFIRAVISMRGSNAGMEMLEVMRQKNVKPCASTIAALSVQYSKALKLDLAEALLDQIYEKCPYPYPYNTFLEACDSLDQPERAVQILAKMKQSKIKPDIWTYEILFSLFGNVNAPYEKGDMLSQVDLTKRINAIEMDMAENGVQHSLLSIKNLLKAMGAEGMTRELLQCLRVAENLLCSTDTHWGTLIYNTVLHSLVEARKSHMAIEVFKNMKSSGFQPDATTYTIMIDCCSTVKCYRSAYALVSMMLRDGFYPQTVTYTALVKVPLKYQNFDEALNLLNQASSEGNQIDVFMFNTILKRASKKGRIDVIELIVEQMHQAKVQPDPATCYYVFKAYVDGGFHSTSVEALQVLSMRMISRDDSTLREMKIEFEDDFILSEDSEAEFRIIQLFKDSDEHLSVALMNLRWCAMAGYPISWSPSQSPWARRLSANYETRKNTIV